MARTLPKLTEKQIKITGLCSGITCAIIGILIYGFYSDWYQKSEILGDPTNCSDGNFREKLPSEVKKFSEAELRSFNEKLIKFVKRNGVNLYEIESEEGFTGDVYRLVRQFSNENDHMK